MDEYDGYSTMDGVEFYGEETLDQLYSSTSHHLNAYPDPEDLPSYSWFGSTVPAREQNARETSRPSPGSSSSSEGNNEDGGTTQPHFDFNDASVDPDFQCGDESAISDELLSEADSEEHPPSPKRRGRPPGKAASSQRQSRKVRCDTRRQDGRRVARGAPGVKRGPRKPLEPNPEFKALHSQATMAFIAHDYEDAEHLALQAINQNPEMFAAHSLLSEIHMARGDTNKATAALFNGAHTRPGDVQVWLRVAELMMERDTNDNVSLIPDAIYCLTRVLNIEPHNLDVRYKRAILNRKLGYLGRAANEYEQMLKYLPHDMRVLRKLADVYVDLGDIDRALQRYEENINHYQSQKPFQIDSFSWDDVNVYAELYGFDEQYEKGIQKLKALSRWLLGRGQDSTWETFSADDREWDLDDKPRRTEVDGFDPSLYERSAYGEGLPLELRVKLAIYRLKLGDIAEALRHFAWLDLEDSQPDAKVVDYHDLYREAADALRAQGLYREALAYYEPLQEVTDLVDASYFCDMALCYWKSGFRIEAEDCYQTAAEIGDTNVYLRPHLAAMCKEIGTSEQSGKLFGLLTTAPATTMEPTEPTGPDERDTQSKTTSSSMLASRTKRPLLKPSALERERRQREQEEREQERDGRIADQFFCLQQSNASSRDGELTSRLRWMSAAQILIQDFRSNSIFYPTERYMKFFGYTSEARAMSNARKAIQVAKSGDQDALERGGDRPLSQFEPASIPQEYRGIQFSTWLDIFLEYATVQAQQGHTVEAYDTITAASDANVFYHSPQSSLLIHICWFTCALFCHDESTLSNVSRWFMQEYQFATDAYRLTAAFHRLCTIEKTWYNSPATQKYLLRQLKAMDFSLVSESQKRTFPAGKAGYTSKDEFGNPVTASNINVALLMLYGQILYCSRGFAAALSYFFRAYAVDPDNPMIQLSIALSYLHQAFKRQSSSRHHLIMQAFSFLSAYYEIRHRPSAPFEGQEADYNVARAFHMLGLTHLAIPFYVRCLKCTIVSRNNDSTGQSEDFAQEAAFALQGLWAIDGEVSRARQVTDAWLTI